jgi:type IV secretory pathway VirB2 component (pilin)
MQNCKTLKRALLLGSVLLVPIAGHCSVESSLSAVQDRLVGTIVPLAAILGLIFAGLSFVAGSPNARSHLMLAMLGAAVAFGASSIVSWIQALVH